MKSRPMIFAGFLLAAAACSGIDNGATAPNVMDLTTSAAYRIPEGATISLSPADAQVAAGATVKLTTSVNSATGQTLHGVASLAVTWVSSDTMIARVSSNGMVLGRSPGVVTVRAIAGTQSAQAKVTVSGAETAPVSSIDTSLASPGTATVTTAAPTATAPATNFQGAILYDDFSTYKSQQDWLARVSTNMGGTSSPSTALYDDGLNVSLASLDQTVTYNGHPTLRYDQPAGVGSTPQLTAFFPEGRTLTHFWFRGKVRFSPGWTTTGTLQNCANAYKLLNWVWSTGVNGRGGIAITNTTQYQVYFNLIQNNNLISPENEIALGNVSTEWTDGRWYDYIVEYNQTSPTTAVTKVWMAPDGQTPVLRGTDYGTTNPGVTWPPVAGVNIGMNFNQVRVNAQQLWWGEWSAYDGNQYPNPYNVH